MERVVVVEPTKKELDHDNAVKNLIKNGIDVVEYERGNTVYQYILDPKDTHKGAGLFIWKIIDFLINHQDFVMLRKADFMAKKEEARILRF